MTDAQDEGERAPELPDSPWGICSEHPGESGNSCARSSSSWASADRLAPLRPPPPLAPPPPLGTRAAAAAMALARPLLVLLLAGLAERDGLGAEQRWPFGKLVRQVRVQQAREHEAVRLVTDPPGYRVGAAASSRGLGLWGWQGLGLGVGGLGLRAPLIGVVMWLQPRVMPLAEATGLPQVSSLAASAVNRGAR